MTDATERAAVACPACSPEADTVHAVLSTGGGQATVRCEDCGHVHKEPIPRGGPVERDVVISQDGESFTATATLPPDDPIGVGDEFVVDAPEAIMAVRVTSLEIGEERRVEEARAREVETVWTRAIDNVVVDVTVHPRDGARDETRSVEVGVPGDREFVVGDSEELGDETVTIEGLVVRGDAEGYPARKLDRDGDAVTAKDVKRVYARDETTTAWSAW